jgi:transposase InsO family protein
MSLTLPADREYLTAAEAAAEALPGFAFKERHIRNIIAEQGIATRPRTGRGGGREFHYSSLPAEARAEYLKRYGRTGNELVTDTKPSRDMKKQLRAQARAAIVDAAEAIIARKGNVGAALKMFAKMYAARKVGAPLIVYEYQPTAEPDQVRAWRRILKRDGLDGLLDSRGRPKASGAIASDLELRNLIIAEIGSRPHLPVHCTTGGGLDDLVRLRLGRDVPVRTLQRFVTQLRPKNNALVKAVAAPGAFNNSHRTAIGSLSQNIVRINQRWELDATRGDAMCIVTGPDGSKTERRMALTMVIDICTRRACIVVSDEPSGAATRAVVRKAILQWGMPEELKTDNGKEFTNYDVERFCREAGITVTFSRPFHPWEKGHVERMFGTVLHGLFEKLPGYVGHNVAQRTEIENKKSFQHRFGVERRVLFEVELSPADLQARIDAWLARMYEVSLHSDLGTTPALAAKAHAGEARLISDPRMLDALMMNAKVRQISKGLIRLNNRFYGSDETGALEVTQPSSRVQVRIDPLDPSWAAIYTADGTKFLCIAKDVDLLPSDERQRMAVVCNANQGKVVNLFVRGIRKIGPTHNIIDTMLASEVPGLTLSGPAAEGMIAAAATKIEKHARMIEARDDMDTPPVAIEPTAAEHEAAARMTADMSPAAVPVSMIACDGYRRPAFEDDVDLIFWWEDFEANGGRLDDEDRDRRKELYADALFCERLAIARRNRTSPNRSAGVA